MHVSIRLTERRGLGSWTQIRCLRLLLLMSWFDWETAASPDIPISQPTVPRIPESQMSHIHKHSRVSVSIHTQLMLMERAFFNLKVVSAILGRNLNDHIHLIIPHDPLAGRQKTPSL